MNLLKLHSIIQHLGGDEIQQIEKALGNPRGKKSKYQILFGYLVKTTVWSETAERQLRKKHFPRYDLIYRAKEMVLEKIILTLATIQDNDESNFEFIKTAFHLEAFEVGKKKLIEDMLDAQEREDCTYLLKLHQFVKELEDYYRLDIDLPEGLVSSEAVQLGYLNSIKLKGLLAQIREAVSFPFNDRKRIALSILSQLQEMKRSWLPESLKLDRVWVRALILKKDYTSALSYQEQIVDGLNQEEVDFEIIIKELELLYHLCIDNGEEEKGYFFLKRLSLVNAKTPLQKRLQKQILAISYVHLSSYQNSKELALAAWLELDSNRDVLPISTQITLVYSMSYIFFTLGLIEESWISLKVLDNYKKPDLQKFSWQISLLRAMISYEKGDFYLLESDLRSATRQVNKAELKGPLIALRALRRFYFGAKEDQKSIDEYLGQLEEVSQAAPEQRAMLYFNCKAWLHSKKRGVPMAEIQKEENSHEKPYNSDRMA